jgi:hypothetical protein
VDLDSFGYADAVRGRITEAGARNCRGWVLHFEQEQRGGLLDRNKREFLVLASIWDALHVGDNDRVADLLARRLSALWAYETTGQWSLADRIMGQGFSPTALLPDNVMSELTRQTAFSLSVSKKTRDLADKTKSPSPAPRGPNG